MCQAAGGGSVWALAEGPLQNYRWREPSHGTFAKSAVAGAVQTLAPARTAYRALDVKVNYLRPVFSDKRDLTARAEVVHRGRQIVIATAEISYVHQ